MVFRGFEVLCNLVYCHLKKVVLTTLPDVQFSLDEVGDFTAKDELKTLGAGGAQTQSISTHTLHEVVRHVVETTNEAQPRAHLHLLPAVRVCHNTSLL